MLLGSISSTKKFFRKTIQSFRSFFGGGDHYEKLPKATPPHTFNNFRRDFSDMNAHQTYNGKLEKFYADFTDNDREKENKKKTVSPPTKQERKPHENEAFSRVSKPVPMKNNTQMERRRTEDRAYSRSVREGRVCAVAQRLKELEMMDISDVDHVLDIEEVLHYYSRLTCPAYLDLVDKFFMEVYTEFLGPLTPSQGYHSKLRLQSLKC